MSLVPGIEIFCLRAFFPNFLSIVFCHTVSKNCVGEPFCVSKTFGYRKIYVQERGEGKEVVSKFSFKKICLAAEKFRSGTLQCATNFW